MLGLSILDLCPRESSVTLFFFVLPFHLEQDKRKQDWKKKHAAMLMAAQAAAQDFNKQNPNPTGVTLEAGHSTPVFNLLQSSSPKPFFLTSVL